MKKTLSILALLSVIGMILTSCMTTQAGTLPPKWWTKSRGEIQNFYKADATGVEQDIVIFIAKNDSALNIDESTAIENARMDAYQQLSRYLSQKVTGVRQNSQHVAILEERVNNGEIDQATADSLRQEIEQRFSNFSASVTSTQFSSFKEEGQHIEEVDGKIIGYVCYSMSDQILKETRELQKQAFDSLMKETEEYKEIMSRIQEVIAGQMEEAIMTEANLR